MNGRKTIRDAIIEKKMQRWQLAAQGLVFCNGIPPSRARKNFWRLIDRYPDIARRLGLDEASVY